MNRKINIGWVLGVLCACCSFLSCESTDYRSDGGISNAHVNMTTYDFLKQHGNFDSLVRIIDYTGMKEVINSDATFFATTDYGVRDYVSARRQQRIVEVGDENIQFGITDIPQNELRDSLLIYLYDAKLNRTDLTTANRFVESKFGPIENVRFNIRLRRVRDFRDYLDYVDYVNFTKVIGTLDADEQDISQIPSDQLDKSFDCQTSGIITTNGVLHVLQNSHRLFFNAGQLSN